MTIGPGFLQNDLALVLRPPWLSDYAACLSLSASHFFSKAIGLR
jgi:hypothetical protein